MLFRPISAKLQHRVRCPSRTGAWGCPSQQRQNIPGPRPLLTIFHRSAGKKSQLRHLQCSHQPEGDKDEEMSSSAPNDFVGTPQNSPEADSAAHQQESRPEGQPLPPADWRRFRANLIATENAAGERKSCSSQWAHQIVEPERGSLLVAKPETKGIFSRSIVLLLDHQPAAGSIGLILNVPTHFSVDDTRLPEPLVAGVFGERRLYVGGPLETSHLHVLHGSPGLADSFQIIGGLYTGGMSDAAEKSLCGELSLANFRCFAGNCGWAPSQLKQELEAGSWWLLAASVPLILSGAPPVWHRTPTQRWWLRMTQQHRQLPYDMLEMHAGIM